jgi:hypothetical protein
VVARRACLGASQKTLFMYCNVLQARARPAPTSPSGSSTAPQAAPDDAAAAAPGAQLPRLRVLAPWLHVVTGALQSLLDSGPDGVVATLRSISLAHTVPAQRASHGQLRHVCCHAPKHGDCSAAGVQGGMLPRSGEQRAREARAVMRLLGEAPPYVFVGHSVGGQLVPRLAAERLEDAAAVVALDSVPPLHWCGPASARPCR